MQQRNTAVTQLAESYGYKVVATTSNLEISLNKKLVFVYTASSNTLLTCKNKYSKQLDSEKYLAYIRTCLKNALPDPKTVDVPVRYSIAPRHKLFCVYDNYTGGKVDSFFEYKDAAVAADKLNKQWAQEVRAGGKHETGK